jgi:hypothetical protein
LTELNPNLKITSSLAEASHSRQIVTSHPDLFNWASNHKTRCTPYQDHLLGTILQNLCMANCYFIKKISELTIQPQLEVRFQKPVTVLQLTALFVKVVVASTYAATSKSPMSLSGFSQTLFGKAQSLMPRDQRLGFDALAAS